MVENVSVIGPYMRTVCLPVHLCQEAWHVTGLGPREAGVSDYSRTAATESYVTSNQTLDL